MSGEARPLVMVLNGACWPGNDASGPNQSLRALAAALKDRFRFHLVARDRPFGAKPPPGVPASDPDFETCSYLEAGRFGAKGLISFIEAMKPSLLWLNGFFDREFTMPVLVARRFGRLPGIPLLLSPRGEFGSGAIGLKRQRKWVYRGLARLGGFLRGITLHATDDGEADDMRTHLPRYVRVETAPNLVALPAFKDGLERAAGASLRMTFLGRIARVKNLDFALHVLASVQTPVRFHIVGPVQEQHYWQECRALLPNLPPQVEVFTHGELTRDASLDLLRRTDLLFLPSQSENFGHAIFEALGSGVPVLVSDRTPWQKLAACQAGFDLPLDCPEAFARAIERFANLPDPVSWRRGARAVAEAYVAHADARQINAAMLGRLVGALA